MPILMLHPSTTIRYMASPPDDRLQTCHPRHACDVIEGYHQYVHAHKHSGNAALLRIPLLVDLRYRPR